MVCIGHLTACLFISCKLGPLIREGVVVMTPATLKQGQPSTYILPGYNFCRNATAPCPRHNQQSTWRAPGLDMGLMDTIKKRTPLCCIISPVLLPFRMGRMGEPEYRDNAMLV